MRSRVQSLILYHKPGDLPQTLIQLLGNGKARDLKTFCTPAHRRGCFYSLKSAAGGNFYSAVIFRKICDIMKKLLSIIAVLSVCICMFGCSDGGLSSGGTQTVIAAVGTTESGGTTLMADKKESAVESSSSGRNGGSTGVKKSTRSSGSSSATRQNTATAAQKTTAGTTKKATTSRTQASVVTCTVEIECKKILSNMDSLKAGHEEYVPDDGIIMSTVSVTVKNGQTVYDAVKSACSQKGVTINAVNSSFGIYIAGFNYIDEKDCGRESGWLYYVNGITPGVSCGKYKVKNGDNIVFSYTC